MEKINTVYARKLSSETFYKKWRISRGNFSNLFNYDQWIAQTLYLVQNF